MTAEHAESTRRYEVAVGTLLPDLTRLPKVSSVVQVLRSTLEAQYCDTDALALAGAGITLLRRTGGSDAGWHLKLPLGGDDRAELAEPLDADGGDVPPELLGHLRAWVRDAELRPVATLSTRRIVHRLLGDDGRVLAEVSNDLVSAVTPPRAPPGIGGAKGEQLADGLQSWREWEIELVQGSRKLVAAADALFAGSGAVKSRWPSRLHRALDRQPDPRRLPLRAGRRESVGAGTAGEVLTAYLAQQLSVILARDSDVRTSVPDAVHTVRVATRRLRSALATFRPLFDRTVTDPIRDELRWWAAVLGGARDAEVQRARLLTAVSAEPADLVLGPLADRIRVELESDDRAFHDELIATMESPRYFRLLDCLDALVSARPLTAAAHRKAGRVISARVGRACRTLADCVDAGPGPRQQHDEWLHEIRKAAKRVRYAAELAEPVLGRPARELAAAAEELQESLGDHQDSVVTRSTLLRIAARMRADGLDTFTVGRVHALQQVRAVQARTRFEQQWPAMADLLDSWRRR